MSAGTVRQELMVGEGIWVQLARCDRLHLGRYCMMDRLSLAHT